MYVWVGGMEPGCEFSGCHFLEKIDQNWGSAWPSADSKPCGESSVPEKRNKA